MFKFVTKAFGKKKKKKKTAKMAKKSKGNKLASVESDTQAAMTVASAEPEPVPASTSGSGLTEREKLIEDALAIHREKSKILDDLPPLLRTKLMAMAMAIYIKQRSETKKN